MQGIYRILVEGEPVVENVITNSGRLGLLNVIAGKRQGFAESIVVGIGTTPATVDDTFLDFIVAYAPIKVAIVDPINERIYFKGSLPTVDQYQIHELGIYPGQFAGLPQQAGAMINNFNANTPWHDIDGAFEIFTTNSKLDATSIGYTIAAGGTVKGYVESNLTLGQLPDETKFSLAYWTDGITSLKLRLKNDADHYFEHSFGVTNGYHIGTLAKSQFTAVGSPTWESIVQVEVEAASTPGGQFSIDGMRYDARLDMTTGMLSRAVMTEPLPKLSGISVDIEYQLDLDV